MIDHRKPKRLYRIEDKEFGGAYVATTSVQSALVRWRMFKTIEMTGTKDGVKPEDYYGDDWPTEEELPFDPDKIEEIIDCPLIPTTLKKTI